MAPPTASSWYRFPLPGEPLKTGDIFVGGAVVAPSNPILTLDPSVQSLRSPEPLTGYNGPISARHAPLDRLESMGPIVDEATFGIGYFILLSYTCDYMEPAKDHPLRFIAPLWQIEALPNDNGLRGFVWNHPESCPAIFFPVPGLSAHFSAAFVNLRQMGIVSQDLVVPEARVIALTQPAKHLLWQKLGFFFTRIRPTTEQLQASDAKYSTFNEWP